MLGTVAGGSACGVLSPILGTVAGGSAWGVLRPMLGTVCGGGGQLWARLGVAANSPLTTDTSRIDSFGRATIALWVPRLALITETSRYKGGPGVQETRQSRPEHHATALM